MFKQMKTELERGFTLSTVKLDLKFTDGDVYETMLFDQHGDEVNCWRTLSDQEAIGMHKAVGAAFFCGLAREAEYVRERNRLVALKPYDLRDHDIDKV